MWRQRGREGGSQKVHALSWQPGEGQFCSFLPSAHAILPQNQGVAGAWAEPKINYFSLTLFVQTFFQGNEKPTHTQNASLKTNVKPTGTDETVKCETLWPCGSQSPTLQFLQETPMQVRQSKLSWNKWKLKVCESHPCSIFSELRIKPPWCSE